MLVVIPFWLPSSRVQNSKGQSFLQNGPTQLLQSFNKLPDHQTDIERRSTHPTQLEMEVNHFSKVLRTHQVDVTLDPALMLDFSCGIEDVPTIDLTKDKAVLCYPLLKGNIADNPEDDLEVPTTAPGHSNHQQTVSGESFLIVAPPHTDSGAAPATSSASAWRIIPTTLLATDKQEFSPQSIGRLKALMSKENRTQTLIKVGAEEASTHFDAHISQDEASYDGDISDADEEDIKVVPDEVDDIQIEGSKPVEAHTVADKEVPEATNEENCGQTLKSMTRNQLKNTATGPHLKLKMVQSAMIGKSLMMVVRTSIPRTISLFTACRGPAELFS